MAAEGMSVGVEFVRNIKATIPDNACFIVGTLDGGTLVQSEASVALRASLDERTWAWKLQLGVACQATSI